MNTFPQLRQWSLVLLEDDDFDAWVLMSAIEELAGLTVYRFSSIDSYQREVENLPKNRIYLLDVDLDQDNGFDFYRSLPDQPIAIMVTAHPEYALDGFEIHAFDFLTKPVKSSRLMNTLMRLEEYLQLKGGVIHEISTIQDSCIEVKEGYVTHQLPLEELLYAEALRDFTKVVTLRKRIIASCNLKYFLSLLPSDKWQRTHRSFAVNLDKVNAMNHEALWIGEVEIPIGKTYREELQSKWSLKISR